MGLFAELYCEYGIGRNLMIFDKDHDIIEEGQSQVALSLLGSYSQA